MSQAVQQPRVPIMVGGNGPNVTWRLAARYADELNLDGMTPAEVRAALPTIRRRCGRSAAIRGLRFLSTSGGSLEAASRASSARSWWPNTAISAHHA